MPDVKFVIGANYGDEGKGLVSASLAAAAKRNDKRCLTILYNGGSQRGHTVEFNGFRHVYHHFAAGTPFGSDTFLHQDFLVNPMTFVEEYDASIECFADANCRIVTPFDMMANQLVEQGRDVRHGSCGMGIFETITRYESNDDGVLTCKLGYLYKSTNNALYNYISEVQKYYEDKRGIRFDTIVGLDVEGLKWHWVDDFNSMARNVQLVDSVGVRDLLNAYDIIIFEGGQGLALDMDNMQDFPHLTPSNTGCKKMIPFIVGTLGEDAPIELYYVTRSYLTRHGNGPMPDGYLDHSMIKQDMTNHPNPWQGTLRLAGFTSKSIADMLGRICKDKNETYSMNNVVCSLVITHTNEIAEIEIPADIFDNIFYSKSKNCTSLINVSTIK